MEPITLDEMFMAAAAGEYSGELPEPVTRFQYYMKKIAEGGSSVNPEDIDAAIESYLNSHDADIVTEQELADALGGYYDKGDMDTALAGKADSADIPDVSSFIDADVDNLANYYDKNDVDDALAGKAAADHNHTGVYAPASHSHAQTDITGLDTALAGKADANHNHTGVYAPASHSHAQTDITGLDTALAGKAASDHTHDDRYYTETEIDNKLSEKSNTGHLHDDRYYTEDETDTLLSGKADSSDIPDVSSFITKAVNDLTNYYTKSETYTQTEIDNMVSAIPKFAIEVVSSLPVQDISPTTVYLLTVQSGEQGNMYDEYIYVGNTWEKLGTQTIDLSGYYTAAEVDALLSGLPVAGHTHDDRYYTEAEIDGKIQTINTALSGKSASDHTHDDRYYTETEIDNKLGGKSNTGHSHVQSDITGLDSALAGKAPASHSHAQTDITDLDTTLAGKADANHNHTGVYAPASHSHAQTDITDLDTTLAGKADANHNHTGVYAPASHSHDGAVASSGGVGGSSGFMTGADKEKLDGQGVVLFEPTGGAAFETGTTITLSTSIAGYRWVEVEITNGIRSRVMVNNGATPTFTMFMPSLVFDQSNYVASLVLRIITMSISGSTLTVSTSYYYNLRHNSASALTLQVVDNWSGGKVFQVVGYK